MNKTFCIVYEFSVPDNKPTGACIWEPEPTKFKIIFFWAVDYEVYKFIIFI